MKDTVFASLFSLAIVMASAASATPLLKFSGYSYVDLGTPAKLQIPGGSPFTVEGWVKLSSVSGTQMLYSKNSGRSAPLSYMLGITDSGKSMCAYTGFGGTPLNDWKKVTLSPTLQAGRWYHLAYSFNGTEIAFYLDGEAVGTPQTFSFGNDSAHSVKISGYANGSDLQGNISDLRLWNRARSQAEVRATMNRRLGGIEPSLVGYWPLDEGQGREVRDITSDGGAGTITTATWETGALPPSQPAPYRLYVAGDTGLFGTVTPAYGVVAGLDHGDTISCDAPAGTHYDAYDSRYRATCVGYGIYTNPAAPPIESDSATSFSYTHNTNHPLSLLVWQWDAEYQVTFAAGTGGETDSAGGWYGKGDTIAVTATAAAGYTFSHWDGNVPQEQVRNATLSFKTEWPISATAVFGEAFHVAPSGNDANDGKSWATAMKTIQAAVDTVPDGSFIIVSNGTYVLTQWVEVTKAVTIRGLGGPDKTILDAENEDGRRIMNVAHPQARVEGLTMKRGKVYSFVTGGALWLSAGVVSNCVIRDSHAYYSGGAHITGGLLTDSVVFNCSAPSSVGAGAGLRIVGGEVANCVISNNTSSVNGGGVYMTGGLLRDSLITGNRASGGSADKAGGIFINGGRVERCRISGNSTVKSGGGIYMEGGTVANSLVTDNYSGGQGGGVTMAAGTGNLLHCTVVANKAQTLGKGLYMAAGSGYVKNSIVYLNGDAFGGLTGDNLYRLGGSVSYSCIKPVPDGDGNTAADPQFVDAANKNYRLFPGSPCIDTAAPSELDGDLDGAPRPQDGDLDGIAAPDMGAFETGNPAALDFSCRFSADETEASGELTALFTAAVAGANTSIIWYGWDFNNDGTFDTVGPDHHQTSHSFGPGFYTVTLTVTNSAMQHASYSHANYIRVAPLTNYVSKSGSNLAPYSSWATAANNIQDAIDAAMVPPGKEVVVLVTNDTYSITAQLVIAKDITLKSVGGRQAAIIDAGNSSGRRVIRVASAGAVVDGFTLKRGVIQNYSDGGGGVLLEQGSVINCRITGCESWVQGAGAWIQNGLLADTIIDINRGTASGNGIGGVYIQGGVVRDCVVMNNTATANSPGSGVRMAGGILQDSLIAFNTSGGPSYQASDGGGLYMSGGTATHCSISNNVTYGHGGGVALTGGLLRNCLVAGNIALTPDKTGGGVHVNGATARVESCTVAGNTAGGDGKGLYLAAGNVVNSIIYGNSAIPNVTMAGGSITYSCMTPLIAAEGNTSGDPLFADSGQNDFRLMPGSSAINKGTNQTWMEDDFDLDGTNRIVETTVDMGAFEFVRGDDIALTCIFSAEPTFGILSLKADFTASVDGGNVNIVEYRWDFGDGASAVGAGLGTVSHTYAPGRFTVQLTVKNDADEEATYTREDYIMVAPQTAYVAKGGSDTPPYMTWGTAASNLQTVIDLGSPEIIVGTGTYATATQINITRAVTIKSDKGPQLSTIDAANSGRVLYVNHADAFVSGLTLARGRIYSWGEIDGGAGLRLQAGGVSNCVIKGSQNYVYGAGVYVSGGELVDSDILNNEAVSVGSNGGGLYLKDGVVRNCRIIGNTSLVNGGGAYVVGGMLTHSLVLTNYAYSSASASGGGIYMTHGLVRNCLIAKNGTSATVYGGGIWMSGGVAEFNTVVRNMANNTGGGVMLTGGGVTNSVICLNTAPTGNDIDGTAGFGHCVSPDLTSGSSGNINGTPLFRDATAGDYSHHGIYSPGVNAGAKLAWARQALDLNGGPRWIGGTPDMGAYESLSVAGTMLMLR